MSNAFDPERFFIAEAAEHRDVAEKTFAALKEPFGLCLALCATSVRNGGKILFFGNGGSAADAQHLATELSIRYSRDRDPIAAIALTTDSSTLTAAGNDLGFDQIFARQISALGKKGDVAIGITTSGGSANVLKALEVARANSLKTIIFTGERGQEAAMQCDAALIVPSSVTARIQEMHITLGQMLCGALEQKLGLV